MSSRKGAFYYVFNNSKYVRFERAMQEVNNQTSIGILHGKVREEVQKYINLQKIGATSNDKKIRNH